MRLFALVRFDASRLDSLIAIDDQHQRVLVCCSQVTRRRRHTAGLPLSRRSPKNSFSCFALRVLIRSRSLARSSSQFVHPQQERLKNALYFDRLRPPSSFRYLHLPPPPPSPLTGTSPPSTQTHSPCSPSPTPSTDRAPNPKPKRARTCVCELRGARGSVGVLRRRRGRRANPANSGEAREGRGSGLVGGTREERGDARRRLYGWTLCRKSSSGRSETRRDETSAESQFEALRRSRARERGKRKKRGMREAETYPVFRPNCAHHRHDHRKSRQRLILTLRKVGEREGETYSASTC